MKKSFLAFLFILSILHGFSQTVLYQKQETINYILKYQIGTESGQDVINYMMREMSEYSNKSIYSTVVTISIKNSIKTVRDAGKVSTDVTLSNFVYSGDVMYKGFNISEVFMPSQLSVKARLRTKANTTIADFSMNPKPFDPSNTTFGFDVVDTTKSTDYIFDLLSLNFIYDDYSKRNFIAKLNLIDKYYDADARMTLAMKDMRAMNIQNLDMLFEYRKSLDAVSGLISELEMSNLPANLMLQYYDPINFVGKITELKIFYNSLSQSVNNTIATLHEIYYNKGLEMVVNENPAAARAYFEKSLQYNNLYAPSQYQLAKLDFKKGDYQAAIEKLKYLFERMNPDANTSSLATQLTGSIFDNYIAIASKQSTEKKFTEALLTLDKAEKVCADITNFICKNTLVTERNIAHNGLYNSYLDKARAQMKTKNYYLAEMEVNRALTYQKQFPAFITTNTEAVLLMNVVQKAIYDKLILDAKTAFTAKSYDSAFSKLQRAENIEINYQIAKSAELQPLLKKYSVPYLTLKIEEGKKLVLENNVDGARSLLTKLKTIQLKYNLTTDKTISAKMTEFEQKLVTQECINARARFDGYLAEASRVADLRDYLKAEEQINLAYAEVDQYSLCGLPDTLAQALKMKLLPAITYQKILKEVNTLIDEGKDEKAISNYIEGEAYYKGFNVSEFGLEHLSLFEFAKTKNSSFQIYSARYLAKNQSPDQSLDLYRILKNKGYPSKSLKNDLINLGISLAKRDYAQTSTFDAKSKVMSYTKNDKWFKELKKAYIKQLKSMN